MVNQLKYVGVISDTHGLLRPEVPKLFRGVDLILHAGDIGTVEVLAELREIAPVIAVRGNNDTGSWAKTIPETEVARIGNVRIHVIHDIKHLKLDPATERFDVIISGHSHKPSLEHKDGVLFLNPGSAGPRRFKLPISVARLTIEGRKIQGKLIDIQTN